MRFTAPLQRGHQPFAVGLCKPASHAPSPVALRGPAAFMRAFERLDEDDGPAPCDDRGLWCSGKARWLLGGRRLCSACKRVAEEAEPHDDTARDGT